MKDLRIEPVQSLKGTFFVQGDKSISHRAVMLASLARGTSEISGFLAGEDCINTVACMRKLGVVITPATITKNTKKVVVQGAGLDGLHAPSEVLDVGNSGTSIRLLSGILAAQSFTTTITGDASIQKRPMDRVVKPLTEMGAKITGTYAPLIIEGTRLTPVSYISPISSAQVKSCVLLAGLFCDGVTSVTEPLLSRDHTERMLSFFGANVERKGLTVSVQGDPILEGKRFTVPGDISSAAFFIVAALILPKAEVVIQNVGINPTRTGIIDVLRDMGADIVLEKEHEEAGEPVADIRVVSSRLSGTVIEGALIPRLIDEIPIIAVAAACAQGTTIIKDAKELRVKESDRIQTMVTELQKFGVNISARDDGMVIEGGRHLRAAACESYGDHRVAMSCAVAGLVAQGTTVVHNVDCIKTSFPGFFDFMKTLKG